MALTLSMDGIFWDKGGHFFKKGLIKSKAYPFFKNGASFFELVLFYILFKPSKPVTYL